MRNLEQIRAAKALLATSAKDANGKPSFNRSDVAGFPSIIINNGLLSAIAFACEEGKEARAGIKKACDETAEHLGDKIHGISVIFGVKNGLDLVRKLSAAPATSLDVQRATNEALSFFNYLKRFAVPANSKAQTPN